MTVRIGGLGILASGLAGWPAASAVLSGRAAHLPGPVTVSTPGGLQAAERRRINANSRWAIAVASEATARLDSTLVAELVAVFASADGDGEVLDQSLQVLADPKGELSPTTFHNSVFNAPSGYWSIATCSKRSSTMICAGGGTAAAALSEAMIQAECLRAGVLCACIDVGYPDSLAHLRTRVESFAFALVLWPDATNRGPINLGRLAALENDGERAGTEAPSDLVEYFAGNQSARVLPLLAAIARGRSTTIRLPRAGQDELVLAYDAP